MTDNLNHLHTKATVITTTKIQVNGLQISVTSTYFLAEEGGCLWQMLAVEKKSCGFTINAFIRK